MRISITNLMQDEVLLALYNNATLNSDSIKQGKLEIATACINAAHQAAKQGVSDAFEFECIDLGTGPRTLEINLSQGSFESAKYNQAYGPNKAEKVIKLLKPYEEPYRAKPVIHSYSETENPHDLFGFEELVESEKPLKNRV